MTSHRATVTYFDRTVAYLKDKRWNDPFEPDDGLRVLICRYRPRGLSRAKVTWHEWERALAPSIALLDAFHDGLEWPTYRRRYLEELAGDAAQGALARLAFAVGTGRPVTLLCSSACTDPARCHRTLARAEVERRL